MCGVWSRVLLLALLLALYELRELFWCELVDGTASVDDDLCCSGVDGFFDVRVNFGFQAGDFVRVVRCRVVLRFVALRFVCVVLCRDDWCGNLIFRH